MIFRYVNVCFPALATTSIFLTIILLKACTAIEANASGCDNSTIFPFQNITACKSNEYYNLDYFKCMPCSVSDKDDLLQATADRFACKCAPAATTVALYDAIVERPLCATKANQTVGDRKAVCKFKFINTTSHSRDSANLYRQEHRRHIRIYASHPHVGSACNSCDLRYNYRYQDYCIENGLLKPYLKYNSFMQPTLSNHFGDLKYVVFFCLALRNSTACNRLANLCVMSFYSMEKHSPCSAFLLSQQTSEMVIKYAHMEEELLLDLRPFLFYKKGINLFTAPAADGPCTPRSNRNPSGKHLQFFSTTYALDGSLRRWGDFSLSQVNLCQLNSQAAANFLQHGIPVAHPQRVIAQCHMTLEHLIELASTITANNNFISLFHKLASDESVGSVRLQTVPILIENLTPENQRGSVRDWLLVKRFQMIEVQPMYHSNSRTPAYEDAHKLSLYRSMRYVEDLEIHYKIYDNNQIGTPLLRLRYKHIALGDNSTLADGYNFRLQVTYERVGEANQRSNILDQIAPPLLLAAAVAYALLHAYNWQKRHTPASVVPTDLCDVACLAEFLLQLVSYMANALLLCISLHVVVNAVAFLTQRSVQITLPIEKDEASLRIVVYTAFAMKLLYFCVHFWRISKFDMFLIDWERPKCNDNNHFNLKSNLDTSSVCSSVRTFVADSGVSAWRVLFVANEWVRLSASQKTSVMVQGCSVLIISTFLDSDEFTRKDLMLKLFVVIVGYGAMYAVQLVARYLLVIRTCGSPIRRFVDRCSLSNISIFILLEPCYGFYIHGRSPHGFSDTDMPNLAMQLQRESQNMCSKRGLLSDSDQQTYIVLPPTNMRDYFERLLTPLQRSRSVSQIHFQKEINTVDSKTDRTSVAHNSVNRLFCAFIDHAIKDMDYIIKEKTLYEKLLNCEFDKYITENKGTFYIDAECRFNELFLYGNSAEVFAMELLLLLFLYILTLNLAASIVVVCLANKVFQHIFRSLVLDNVSTKTAINKCFLI